MRRVGALLAVLSGIALIVAAFLDIVSKKGGNIVTEGGNVPATLGGFDSWPGWALLGAGILVVLAGLGLLRYRSRLVAAVLLLGGAVAAAAGIWALVDPLGFYVQVGALQVGEDADTISNIVEQFDNAVTAEIGAWIAAVAGGLAALIGLVFIYTPRSAEGAVHPSVQPGYTEPVVNEGTTAALATTAVDDSTTDEAVPSAPVNPVGIPTREQAADAEAEPEETIGLPPEPPPADEDRPPSTDADGWR